MGILEAIVVVYLRQIYYPNGFKFPLAIISNQIIKVELLRETCTLIMLVSIAWIASKNKLQIFSYFLLSFALWDIVYYIGLKLLLDWPSSFFTWDILFLIPIPWVGPVISPIIISVTMIILASVLLYIENHNSNLKLKFFEWFLIYLGAVLIFASFIWDYSAMIFFKGFDRNAISIETNNSLNEMLSSYVPNYFHWEIFSLGLIAIYLSIYLIIKRNLIKRK